MNFVEKSAELGEDELLDEGKEDDDVDDFPFTLEYSGLEALDSGFEASEFAYLIDTDLIHLTYPVSALIRAVK